MIHLLTIIALTTTITATANRQFDIFQRERLVAKHTPKWGSREYSVKNENKHCRKSRVLFDKSPGYLCVFYGSLQFFFFVWAMNKYCTVAVYCSGSKKISDLNYCCFPVSPWEVLRKRAGKKVKRLIDPRICLLHFKKTDIAISISGGKNIPSGSYSTIL